jgi:hypothetical protein
MRRILLGMLTCMLTVALAGPVAASPPERERFIDDERFTYDCNGVLITEDGGHYDIRLTLKEYADERVRAIFVGTARQVTASDEDGNAYRISGSGSGTAVWASMDDFLAEEEPIQGHFGFRLTIRHATGGGKVGQVWLRIQLRPDGTETFVDRGDCVELGPA